jgi:ribosome-associated protein
MTKSIVLEDYARKIVDVASDNLGEEVLLLDTSKSSLFADYSVVVTGQTDRHLENLAQKIMRAMKKDGYRMHHREGTGKSGWILLDYFGINVHLFSEKSRSYYDLESLWSSAKEIVRVQ